MSDVMSEGQTEAMSEVSGNLDEPMVIHAPEAPSLTLSKPAPGVPWVLGIFLGATASYLVARIVYGALNIGNCKPTCALFSIGTSTLGAAIATTFALAANKPFDKIQSNAARGSLILALSFLMIFGFWSIFAGPAGFSMTTYAFPIIGTAWFFIAATSFIGEDAHVAQLSPGRRTLLNVILWIVGTTIVVRAITWIPAFWFGFIQTLLVTGGFAYFLRGVKQPTKSFYAWSILALLTGVAIVVSSAFHVWDIHAARFGPWAFGGPTAEWGIFFGLWCGLNYGVLAPLQSWPFSRIRQPLGTTLAVLSVVAWCAVLTFLVKSVFDAVFADHAQALLEGQVWAWHTVIWGFTFSLVFGAGFRPYLWKGQKTPGTWDDLER
jgi:predicted membrane protein